MEPTIAAVRAYATLGEMITVLRGVHSSWAPTSTY
jgi:hypothetical protein